MPRLLWGITADELTRQTGVAGGLCVFPRATPEEVKLALELAKRPTFIVHVMAREEAQVARIRTDAAAAGVLGRTFYVEQGNAASLPFASRLVDLMVVSNLSDADLTPQIRSEWLRVIAPGCGVALVGCAGQTGTRLSKEKLGAWAGNSPLTKVQEDASGTWVRLRANLPAGSDAWTHYLHGAERSQSSMDTALQAPFLTQWWGEPRREGFWGTVVVACNGRMFSIRGSNATNNVGYALLTARSMNNGIVLWQRELCPYGKDIRDGGFTSSRSCVATEDSLFLIDRDGVLRLDAETGKERGRIMGPKPKGQIKWIAMEGKLLAMMAGDSDSVLTADFLKDMPPSPGLSTKKGQINNRTMTETPMGRDLAVYDIESGKTLWHDTVAGDILEYLISMRDQRLYYPAEGVGMTCRNVQNGQVVWTNPAEDLKASFNQTRGLGYAGVVPSLLSVWKDALIMRDTVTGNHMALSIKDGALLWKKGLPHCSGSPGNTRSTVWGDTILSGNKAFDLKTGKETTGPFYIYSGCGITISTPNYLITCMGRVSDAKSNQLVSLEDAKGPCLNGAIVSDGMMISIPSDCKCYFEIKGYRALASAGNIKPHTAPPWKDRLAVFDALEPQPLNIGPADWPTYRHDPQRSAGSAATVGEKPKRILWQWKPSGMEPYSKPYAFEGGLKPDFLATAPVAADGLVWFGSPDGMIRCVKADTGSEVWSFATGGMLFKPPTLWQGLLLAGGGDGNVYCLDARTGKCLWRLQAAPLDRRVFWYGHLINTWPVIPGVVVQDNIAYAVAGYQKGNGVHAYAINPKNGQVIWEKDNVGSFPNVIEQKENNHVGNQGFVDYSVNAVINYHYYTNGVVSYHKNEREFAGLDSHGSMAVGENKLWLPGGCLDLKNGEEKGYGTMYGGEIGLLNKWVMQGGRRITENEDTLSLPGKTSDITISTLSNDEEECKTFPLNRLGVSIPAWDTENILLPPIGRDGLSLLPRTKFATSLTDCFSTTSSSEKPISERVNSRSSIWKDLELWNAGNVEPAAFVLAKDQAVVAGVASTTNSGKAYKLSGYFRSSGKSAWTIDLPEQPAMNRLALDKEGRVLVSLCDGSVVCVGQ